MKQINLYPIKPTAPLSLRGICQKAVQTYGFEHQLIVAIEELSELTKALTKWIRYGGEDSLTDEELLIALEEERADVTIMLEQLNIIFGENDETLEDKLQRLANHLEEKE